MNCLRFLFSATLLLPERALLEQSGTLERICCVNHQPFLRGLVRLVAVVFLALVSCAPVPLATSPGASVSPGVTTPQLSSTTSTATPTMTPGPGPTTVATRESTMPTQPSTHPTGQLVSALELAATEMRAASADPTLSAARAHAEGAVNILVGAYGRWYGDQDGDHIIADPSNGQGVLPGEKIPSGGADLDTGDSGFPFGLALRALGPAIQPPPGLANLLGDVTVWRTKPRSGYDQIATAIALAQLDPPRLGPLQGSVPRAVALGRLILTRAVTPAQAQSLAAQAAAELANAVANARTLTP